MSLWENIINNLPEVKRIHDGLYGILIDLKGWIEEVRGDLDKGIIPPDKALQTFEEKYKLAQNELAEISREEDRNWSL